MSLRRLLVRKSLPVCGLSLTLSLFGCGGGAGVNVSGSPASPTPPTPPAPSVPGVPASLHATASSAEIVLNWSAGAGASSYAVKRGTASGGPYTQIGTATSTSYTDTGLTNGTAYYYVVVAVNSAGQSAPSGEATATPDATVTAPPVPAGLLASAGNAQVGLTWTVSRGASSYHIKRATASGGPFTVIGTPTAASYIDTGLANGTTYYYVVSALDSAGESSNSTQVSATPTGTSTSNPPAVCLTPFSEDTNATTVTVGSGTAASCTEIALANALAKGGVIRFSCGGAATITLTSQKTLRTNVNTTLDGQGKITLDGRGTTRLLYYSSPNFQATKTVVTIQNLTLQNGAASGTPIPAAPAPCSQGTKNDGGGAAIYIRDGILRVWNTTFKNNGGAIGSLWGNLSIYNSQFSSNQATGNGANGINSACPVGGGQSGNGGNGGAVVIDGAETFAVTVCGSTFTSNSGGTGG